MTDRTRSDLPCWLVELVRRKAARLARPPLYCPGDAEDLAQELLLKALEALPQHDEAKTDIHVFARMVVARRAVNLARDQRAMKRAPSRSVSLHIMVKVGEGESAELSQEIGDREQLARTCGAPRASPDEEFGLVDDVRECLRRLSPELRSIAEEQKYSSISEVARQLGLPRTTLQRRIGEIIAVFEDRDMADYLR